MHRWCSFDMPLIQVLPKSKTQVCTINAEGKFSIPASILDKLEWQHGSRISLTYLENPLTVILKRINNDDGFKLMRRTSPTSPNPAGILTCAAFTNSVLKPKIVLPIRNINPIILNHSDSSLALVLESPSWTQVDFSQAGRQLIPTNIKGVYQLLDSAGEVV